jgi:hypothetical protein
VRSKVPACAKASKAVAAIKYTITAKVQVVFIFLLLQKLVYSSVTIVPCTNLKHFPLFAIFKGRDFF